MNGIAAPPGRRPWRVATMGLLLLVGCSSEPDTARAPDPSAEAGASADRNFPQSVYERNVVFITLSGDSALVVPWLFRTESTADEARREIAGWLSRGETWDPFYGEAWSTPPTRSPFRIHPHGPIDIVVGQGDALESIVYEEGARLLETTLDEPLATWSGPRGESVRLHRGAVLLGDQRYEARALDLSRSHASGQPAGGEWMMLEAGPDLSLVLAAPVAGSATPAYVAWALSDDEELRWPSVAVEWLDLRPFEDARRDVPMSWSFRSDDGELVGSVSRSASHLQVGEGSGPLLPVEGLFRVRGTVEIRGDSTRVRGVIRHIQR